jgi:hypothetical protein
VGFAYYDIFLKMHRLKKTPTGELRQHNLVYDGAASPNNVVMFETPVLEPLV